MHTHLVFFDTTDESIKGTIRGLVAFLIILFLDYIWYELLMKSFYDSYTSQSNLSAKTIGIFVSSLLLCSSLTVQLASSPKEAIIYGALVGLVVYGFYNSTNCYRVKGWDCKIGAIDTVFGIVSTSLVSFIVYKIFFG
jgi:uncharacterized membrane protein